jgi:L-amino acid N-acyltransferase YncA
MFYYTASRALKFPQIGENESMLTVRPMQPADWDTVRAIYLEGIATRNATFEQSAPEWEKWDQAHSQACRLVAPSAGQVLGWAALSPVSARRVYAGVAEASIYVAAAARGKGFGRLLLTELIAQSEKHGIWSLQTGIFPENTPSLNLFTSAGFRVVGTRERIGYMDGRWRDVLLLERRSAVAGQK